MREKDNGDYQANNAEIEHAIADAKLSIAKLGRCVLSGKGKSATEGAEIAELSQNTNHEDAQARARRPLFRDGD